MINVIDMRKFIANITEKEFWHSFQEAGKIVIKSENRSFDFITDENNRRLIRQLYYYINYDKRYEGDLEKGLYISGQIGSGKSILIKIFIKVIELECKIIFTQLNAHSIIADIALKDFVFFAKRPLYLDDIGREPLEAKSYGTVFYPLEDLIGLRDHYNAITFASGNHNLNTFKKRYAPHIFDRMQAMFNIHELPGPSRRV